MSQLMLVKFFSPGKPIACRSASPPANMSRRQNRDHGKGSDQTKIFEELNGLGQNLWRRSGPKIMKHQRSRNRKRNQDQRRPACPDSKDQRRRAAQFDHDSPCRQQAAKPAFTARQARSRKAERHDFSDAAVNEQRRQQQARSKQGLALQSLGFRIQSPCSRHFDVSPTD